MATPVLMENSGRSISKTEFDMECRALTKGWDISDELREDVIATCHRLVKEGNDRESQKAAATIVNIAKLNLEIYKAHKEERREKGLSLIQNNIRIEPGQEDAIYAMLARMSGMDAPSQEMHQPSLVVEQAEEESDSTDEPQDEVK